MTDFVATLAHLYNVCRSQGMTREQIPLVRLVFRNHIERDRFWRPAAKTLMIGDGLNLDREFEINGVKVSLEVRPAIRGL